MTTNNILTEGSFTIQAGEFETLYQAYLVGLPEDHRERHVWGASDLADNFGRYYRRNFLEKLARADAAKHASEPKAEAAQPSPPVEYNGIDPSAPRVDPGQPSMTHPAPTEAAGSREPVKRREDGALWDVRTGHWRDPQTGEIVKERNSGAIASGTDYDLFG